MSLVHHLAWIFLKAGKTALLKRWQRYLLERADHVEEQSDRSSCLVVAPHPDDETLGCGGTILRKRSLGTKVVVVVCTDGCHSSPSNIVAPTELAEMRRREVHRACQVLGLEEKDIVHLVYEDGTLETNVERLAEELAGLNDKFRPDEILVTFALDEHPDHQAASRAIRSLVAAGRIRCRVAEYPISFWAEGPWLHRNYEKPLRRRIWNSLRDLLRSSRALDVEVVSIEGWLEEKRRALYAHESQTKKLAGEPTWTHLEEDFIANFLAPYEIFFLTTSGERSTTGPASPENVIV